MTDKKTINLLSSICSIMFRKNFFGIYHGAISAKTDQHRFLINKTDSMFDKMDENAYCDLSIITQDYRWNTASMDSHIHANIYNNIHEAKYIAFGVPLYTTAYSLTHDKIVFEDYFGKTMFNELPIYDPGDFSTWYDRNGLEITKYLKESNNHVMIIKGVGTYVYDRDINSLLKKIAILENSCRLLSLKSSF